MQDNVRNSDSSSAAPTRWHIFGAYLALGTQSFGGGPALLFLMRRVLIERKGWLSEEEFNRAYALTQITPGINLVALTVLIGWRLAGAGGIVAALSGLLLPSVSITILLTALYASIRQFDHVQAALRGVVPATAAITFLLAVATARPLIIASWREGQASLLLSCSLVVGSALLVGLADWPVIAVLLLMGAVGAFAQYQRNERHQGDDTV